MWIPAFAGMTPSMEFDRIIRSKARKRNVTYGGY